MRNTHLRRFLALLIVLLMTCAGASAATVKAGETISSTSRWINSDIEGSVDENTVVSVKDDFHTAANLEWLLSEDKDFGVFYASDELLYDRKMEIVLGDAQSTVLSIFVYVLIGIDIVSMLLMLGTMFGFDWIETLRLNNLTVSYLVGLLHSRLVLGQFSLLAFLGVCAYIAIGVFGTCKLFGRQELDF